MTQQSHEKKEVTQPLCSINQLDELIQDRPFSVKSGSKSRKSRIESARSSGRRSNRDSNKSKDSHSPTEGGIPPRTFDEELEDEIVA